MRTGIDAAVESTFESSYAGEFDRVPPLREHADGETELGADQLDREREVGVAQRRSAFIHAYLVYSHFHPKPANQPWRL